LLDERHIGREMRGEVAGKGIGERERKLKRSAGDRVPDCLVPNEEVEIFYPSSVDGLDGEEDRRRETESRYECRLVVVK
jgi:hypothetical protein